MIHTRYQKNNNYLSVVFSSPTLDKGHPDGAHFGQFIHSFKPMVNRLSEQGGKLLIVEYFQTAAGWYLANCGGMEAMVIVAVAGLNKDGAV